MQAKKQQSEMVTEQKTGSKLRKEYVKAVTCLFNFYMQYIMRNTRLDESQTRTKIAERNINNLRYTGDTTLNSRKQRGTKELLDEG